MSPQSNFERDLKATRVYIDLLESMSCLDSMVLSIEQRGLFFKMLPYTARYGIPADSDVMAARVAGVSLFRFRKHWPGIKHLFVLDGNTWRVKDSPWLRVICDPPDRQSVRHLYDRLVAFWGERCAYCEKDTDGMLHIEHIVPVSRGGTNDLQNLTLACPACNSRKRTKTAAEFGFPHIHDMAARIQ